MFPFSYYPAWEAEWYFHLKLFLKSGYSFLPSALSYVSLAYFSVDSTMDTLRGRVSKEEDI